jgi:sec-independent protein translocase protein TatA
MGAFSIWHWLIVLAVVVILFGGGGKISRLMGDFGRGLKNFKSSMKENEASNDEAKAIDAEKSEKVETVSSDQAAKS